MHITIYNYQMIFTCQITWTPKASQLMHYQEHPNTIPTASAALGTTLSITNWTSYHDNTHQSLAALWAHYHHPQCSTENHCDGLIWFWCMLLLLVSLQCLDFLINELKSISLNPHSDCVSSFRDKGLISFRDKQFGNLTEVPDY